MYYTNSVLSIPSTRTALLLGHAFYQENTLLLVTSWCNLIASVSTFTATIHLRAESGDWTASCAVSCLLSPAPVSPARPYRQHLTPHSCSVRSREGNLAGGVSRSSDNQDGCLSSLQNVLTTVYWPVSCRIL